MTRRTRVLLYTWVLSWAAAMPAMWGFDFLFLLVTEPYWDVVGRGDLAFLQLAYIASQASLFAPGVYFCWRVVVRFVPDVEDEEGDSSGDLPMTRCTKLLLYTWLLSWAAAVFVLIVLDLAWQYPAIPAIASGIATGGNDNMIVYLSQAERTLNALVIAPVVFLSWRAVNKFVPHDEDEE